jgi:hypothetical protein
MALCLAFSAPPTALLMTTFLETRISCQLRSERLLLALVCNVDCGLALASVGRIIIVVVIIWFWSNNGVDIATFFHLSQPINRPFPLFFYPMFLE